MDTRKVPLHPSLIQPILMGGAEREAVILSWFLCVGAGVLLHPTYLFLPLFLGVGAISQLFLRKLAVSDPEMLKVFRRHYSHQEYYPAQAHVTSMATKKKNNISITQHLSTVLVKLMGN